MLFICTLQEIKEELEIKDPADDVVLTRHAEGLQDRFEEYLNRDLLRAENFVEICDGGAHAVLLSRFPLESVATVHQSQQQVWDDNSLVDAKNYTLHLDRGRVIWTPQGATTKSWAAGEQSIRVVYTGGYVGAGTSAQAGQTPMPDAIRGGYMIQFSYEWRNRRTLGTSAVSAQGSSVTMSPAKLLAMATEAMGHFRRF